MGDPAGIGGELILKALPKLCKGSIPVVVGDLDVIERTARRIPEIKMFPFKGFGLGKPGDAEAVDLKSIQEIEFGVTRPAYGEASFHYIIEALKLVVLGGVSAIVTCPINKASIHSAGISFPGHTELLAHYGGVTDYVMMMANKRMRVTLATIHIPLADVPNTLSAERIFKCLFITHRSLKEHFNIPSPRIKVCGLNPHAGEQGIIGTEEGMIREALQLARSRAMDVEGPFPADTLFHRVDCDAFVAMYHDQGLIPVKTIDFRRTVNVTLGLPFVRTSPGHGTGFDIAGHGIADPTGLMEAYRLAEQMSAKNFLTKHHPSSTSLS